MQFRLRTLLIVLALAVAWSASIACFTKPAAEAASDYVFNRIAWAVYRGHCGATFD